MFLEAESEVQKPGLNYRKGMPQVKGYFRFSLIQRILLLNVRQNVT